MEVAPYYPICGSQCVFFDCHEQVLSICSCRQVLWPQRVGLRPSLVLVRRRLTAERAQMTAPLPVWLARCSASRTTCRAQAADVTVASLDSRQDCVSGCMVMTRVSHYVWNVCCGASWFVVLRIAMAACPSVWRCVPASMCVGNTIPVSLLDHEVSGKPSIGR